VSACVNAWQAGVTAPIKGIFMDILILERTLTELDHIRLSQLARSAVQSGCSTDLVQSILESARRVPSRAIPPDIVTMYSQVLLAFPMAARRS
jgi:hypothetical protein